MFVFLETHNKKQNILEKHAICREIDECHESLFLDDVMFVVDRQSPLKKKIQINFSKKKYIKCKKVLDYSKLYKQIKIIKNLSLIHI